MQSKIDSVLIPAGTQRNQGLADRCGRMIQRCVVCGKITDVDNVLVLPLASGEKLALGFCGGCVDLPQAQLQKIVHGVVEFFQTRASHMQINPN